MRRLEDEDLDIFDLDDLDAISEEEQEDILDNEEIEYYEDDTDQTYYEEDTDGEYYADDSEVEYMEDDSDIEYFDEDFEEEEFYIEPLPTRMNQRVAKMPVQAKEPVAAKATGNRENPNNGKNRNKKKQENFFMHFLKNMSGMDALVSGTGILVLIIAIVTVSLWGNNKSVEKQVAGFGEVGTQLSNLQVVGESGLLAVTEAQIAKAEALEQAQEEAAASGVEETEDSVINCKVTYTSMEKDLKIKFVSEKTGKLIANKDFQIEVTGPDKKTVSYNDHDKDGIIYKTKLAAGKYKVKVLELDGVTFSDMEETVTVKDKIEYQKVDVAAEVKTEAQINAAVEDTAQAVVQETVLADTVEFVASSKTATANASGYQQVDKSTIPNPATLVSAGATTGGYTLLTSDNVSGNTSDNTTPTPPSVIVGSVSVEGTSTVKVAGTTQLTAKITMTSGSDTKGVTWTSSDTNVASVNGSGLVTAKAKGTVTITATSVENTAKSGSLTVTVSEAAYHVTEVTLDKTTAALFAGGSTQALVATVKSSDGTNTKSETSSTAGVVTWTSSDATVAKVDPATGVVTPLKAGTATITATTSGKDIAGAVKTVTCTVTVTATSFAVSMEAKLTAYVGKTTFLAATVTKNGAASKTDGTANTKNLVTWSVSDKAIATIDATTGVITPVKAGSVIVTATTVEKDASGKQLTATCTVTVKANPEADKTTVLKDNAGNQMYYIADSGQYVKATWADYYTKTAFFKQVTAQYTYTGWQTIDNKTYFYDKNGKYVTGEQVIQGVKYNFTAEGVLNMGNAVLGIDVSKFNGSINWTAVKNSGVSFVIIRCGFRGSSSGALVEDLTFKTNIKGATDAGLKVGIYFFTQAVNEVEAVEEASMVLGLVKNYKISYPIFIDTEPSGGRGDKIDVGTRTAVCRAFCETIRNAGYTPGIYASKSWYNNKLSMSSLNSYKVWLAQYATAPSYSGKYDLWQFTSSGTVGGISGRVDLNYSYMGY